MLKSNLRLCYAESWDTLDPLINVLYVYFKYQGYSGVIVTKADYIYLPYCKNQVVLYLN